MVEQVNSRTTAAAPIAAAARVAAPQKAGRSATPATADAAAAPSLARQLSAAPPIDLERVRRIRDAVEAGNFPLVPSTIADSLIALRYEWMSSDEA